MLPLSVEICYYRLIVSEYVTKKRKKQVSVLVLYNPILELAQMQSPSACGPQIYLKVMGRRGCYGIGNNKWGLMHL